MKSLEQTLFVAAPQFVDKKQITFEEVIATLLGANFMMEKDDPMKKEWAK